MRSKNEPVVIQAEFSQDPTSGEWIATSLRTPRLSARAIEVRRARESLAKLLSEKLGKPVQIEDRVKVPRALADDVAAYQRDLKKKQELTSSLEERFLPLVKSLLRERLQLQQIAVLLGVSKQWLSQQLKQDATGSYRNTSR